MGMHIDQVFEMVEAERRAQDEKWGDQSGNTPERWSAILSEENGEVARAILDGSPREVLADELVQVAAVAVAWIQALLAESCKVQTPFCR